jgi:hypothetical protein
MSYGINICYKKTTYYDDDVESEELAFVDYELSDKITDDMIEWRGLDAHIGPKYLKMYAIPDEELKRTRKYFHYKVYARITWEIQYGEIVPKSARFSLKPKEI